MEGAESGVVLRAGLLEAHVFADDLEDVRLLLYGLGEVVGHRSGYWDLGTGLRRRVCLRQASPHFLFQRTPSLESSRIIPFSANSLRIASARAKLRRFLAWVRSSTRASIWAS